MTYTEDLEARLEYAQGQADRYAKMAATLKGALGDATKLDQKLEALREEFPTLDREMNSPRAGAAKAKPVKFDLDGIEAILRQAGKPLHMKALAEAAGYEAAKLQPALHRSTRFENQGGNTWWVSGEAIPEAASEAA